MLGQRSFQLESYCVLALMNTNYFYTCCLIISWFIFLFWSRCSELWRSLVRVLDMVIDGWNLKCFQSFIGPEQYLSSSYGYLRLVEGAAVWILEVKEVESSVEARTLKMTLSSVGWRTASGRDRSSSVVDSCDTNTKYLSQAPVDDDVARQYQHRSAWKTEVSATCIA